MRHVLPSLESGIIVQNATEADVTAIQAIYAQEVLHGLATFEETPPTSNEPL
ncbi:MAG: hypothetical protein V3T13_05050 [Hyphomicrobium sp.]